MKCKNYVFALDLAHTKPRLGIVTDDETMENVNTYINQGKLISPDRNKHKISNNDNNNSGESRGYHEDFYIFLYIFSFFSMFI